MLISRARGKGRWIRRRARRPLPAFAEEWPTHRLLWNFERDRGRAFVLVVRHFASTPRRLVIDFLACSCYAAIRYDVARLFRRVTPTVDRLILRELNPPVEQSQRLAPGPESSCRGADDSDLRRSNVWRSEAMRKRVCRPESSSRGADFFAKHSEKGGKKPGPYP